MQSLEDEITKFYRIRKTAMEMVRDRGYFVTDFEVNMTKQQFVEKFGDHVQREDLVMSKTKWNDDSEQIYVFFPEKKKVGVKTVNTYIDRMKSENVFRAILVAQQALTSFARNCIMEASSNFKLEVFMDSDLLINITDHVLVPKHQLLTDEEKKTLLERYNVKETQLPRIEVSDPVARYYGMNPGQVVKIIRYSETAIRFVTYRYVI